MKKKELKKFINFIITEKKIEKCTKKSQKVIPQLGFEPMAAQLKAKHLHH